MRKLYQILPLIACFFSVTAFAQEVTFSNQSELLQNTSGFSYEDCVVDMNIDGYDDVVRVTDAGLYIDYQNPDGSGFTPFFYATSWQRPPSWSIAAADINGDGYRDLCFGNGQRVGFVTSSMNGQVWTEEVFPEYIFSQRSSFNDIDLDGDIDAFVCHDVDRSHVYYNDGNGNMMLSETGAEAGIDFETHNGPGNYANMWVDYDNDGDTDFYLTKCRQGGSPGDIDVINQMYRNNGDGSFTEVGALTNTDDPDQSWTTVFEDFDNDGDFDLFTVNHDIENRLQWNNGDGTFSDNDVFDSGINPYDLGAWELDAHDINNDGFVDIISEFNSEVYYNNGDGTFTGADLGFSSGGFGDLNNDGFLDVVRGNTLYINNGNNNNYVRVNLLGILSNTDGIGARVEVVTSDGMSQIREVRSGRSFSPMSNLSANFGIAENTSISEIIVKWPSGVITVLENPAANTTHLIPEAECLAGDIAIEASSATEICPGESVTITAPAGGSSYVWSNGDNAQSITVDQQGTYSLAMYNDDNCVSVSNNISVMIIQDPAPEIIVQGETELCAGASVILSSSDADNYEWNNEQTTQFIEVSESGSYSVSVPGQCGMISSEAIEVTVLEAELPSANDIGAGQGDQITLQGTGSGTLTWYSDESLTEIIGTGTSVDVPDFTLEEQTTFYVTNTVGEISEEQSGGKDDLGADGTWGTPSLGGYSLFNAFEDFTLVGATIYADGDGPRTFTLTDESENAVVSETFELVDGENYVEFDWDIPAGNGWSIRVPGTDLYRNDAGVNYPYAIGTVGSLYTSNFGTQWYYYLYDWKVRTPGFACVSEPVEVVASIVSVEEIAGITAVELFPNPAFEMLNLSYASDRNQTVDLQVVNALGQVVFTKSFVVSQAVQNTELNISDLESGVYSARFVTPTGELTKAFVKK